MRTDPPIDPVAASYSLSPSQLETLRQARRNPTSRTYVHQVVCSLDTSIDSTVFRRAWQRVVDRHPILRTRFRFEDFHEPAQEVLHQVLVSVDERDLTDDVKEDRLEAFLHTDRQRGFGFDDAPLMRVTVLRLTDGEHKFVWTFCDGLLDDSGYRSILKEVLTCYEALCRGSVPDPQPVYPFQDYIDWLDTLESAHAERYWRNRLKGFLAPTPLVVDHPDASPTGSLYGTKRVSLSEASIAGLRALVDELQVNLHTLLQGAWVLLLNRYSGASDVVIGLTSPSRHSTGGSGESRLGSFLNTLPVRAQVDPDELLVPWLKNLHQQTLTHRDFEHVALTTVQEWSEVPTGTRLFNGVFVIEDSPVSSVLCRRWVLPGRNVARATSDRPPIR